jgi:hypothetical protein
MGREARANKSAEKSARAGHQKPAGGNGRNCKVWTTDEMRTAVLTGKLPTSANTKPETFQA